MPMGQRAGHSRRCRVSSPPVAKDVAVNASWLPLIVVVLTQIQASFAVNALTVSMAGITSELNTPATNIGTAITAGTFAMAAFILLGAKVGAKFGSRKVFQIAVASTDWPWPPSP